MRIPLTTLLILTVPGLLAACGTKTPLTLPAPRLAPAPAASPSVSRIAPADDNNNAANSAVAGAHR
jgi:predicted small lipoprotein YifL